MGDNRKMLEVFRNSGFSENPSPSTAGIGHVVLSLAAHRSIRGGGSGPVAKRGDRLDARLLPTAGRRRRRRQPGAGQDRARSILNNLEQGGLHLARLVPGSSHDAAEIGGHRAYPRVTDAPDPVDLAVIAVPAEQVRGGRRLYPEDFRAIRAITAGFGESDVDGARPRSGRCSKSSAGGMPP